MSFSADPYRIFPPATQQERADLQASIEAVGLRNPVVIDENKNVIDGHERRDVCLELGIDWLTNAAVHIGLSDDQKKALAIELNLWRRPIHLSRRKRKELVEIYVIAYPELSETTVAEFFGVSQPTVNRIKKRLIQMNKLKPPEATIGKDGVKRKIGQRSGTWFIAKNEKEFDRVMPDLEEVKDELHGLIRRPKQFASKARRKRKQREIRDHQHLPAQIQLKNCDWRDLKINSGTVDLILTDVMWSRDQEDEWSDLAAKSWTWLKPDGIFASYIGTTTLMAFGKVVEQYLSNLTTIAVLFKQARRDFATGQIDRWRPVPVFCPNPNRKLCIDNVIHCPGIEKEYGEWQQSLPVSKDLVLKLSDPKSLVVDPQMGTGTNAVATALIGEGRRFIGCDINSEMVRIARHRVATEGLNDAD